MACPRRRTGSTRPIRSCWCLPRIPGRAISACLQVATLRGRVPGALGRIARHDDRPPAPVRAAGRGRPPQAGSFRSRGLGLPWLGVRMAAIRRWRERLPGPSLDGNPVLWREWHRSRPSRMARILWGIYWLGAHPRDGESASTTCSPTGSSSMTGGFMIHTALVLQSVLGLMLLSVQAPTALGEERLRGSLDVLMAAPISTRAIVWGKWMGTYRVVLWLAILPGVAAAVIAATVPDVPPRFRAGLAATPIGPIGLADRVLAPMLIVAEMLSWGAAFTSLGLLLATWTPRVGRAIGISFAVFLLLSFGWLFLAGIVILPALTTWLTDQHNIDGSDLIWIEMGMLGLQPRGRAHHDHPGAG